MREFLLVGIGGMIGSMARYAASLLLPALSFPLATFVVNILGCLIIGIVFGYTQQGNINPALRLLLATGICGGFTTFSTFSAETLLLLRDGNILLAMLYVGGSLSAGIFCTWLGMRLADWL